MRGVRCAAALLAAAVWAAAPAQAAGADPPAVRGVLPVSGPVARGFDPPDAPWGAGHRGVDLATAEGAVVVAPRDGVVSYAAVLAGRPVLVLSHGDTRSTFEPVEATVPVGTRVLRGQPIGRLVAGHACPAAVCLHWGLKRGDAYLDPLSLLRGEVVLLPSAASSAPR